MVRLIVDAMNVVGSRPTGWWRDRPGALRDLLNRVQRFVATTGHEAVVVLDVAPSDLGEGTHDGVRVVHARRAGRNAADDRIAELVGEDPEPSTLRVVSSDRELRRRVRAMGAGVWSAQDLLRRLDQVSGDEGNTPSP